MKTLIVILVACGMPTAAAAAGPKPKGESGALILAAKKAVIMSLKDAPSAIFRNVKEGRDVDRRRVCGEVNAKNGYGGYTGFQKFVYFPDTGESEILDEDFSGPTEVNEKAAFFGSCFGKFLLNP